MNQRCLMRKSNVVVYIIGLYNLKSPGMIALSFVILFICALHFIKEILQVCAWPFHDHFMLLFFIRLIIHKIKKYCSIYILFASLSSSV